MQQNLEINGGRGQWSSRLAFILASTGAAVGLGNIWKFPYMAGDNGGSAFVIVYLICVALIGIPLMLAEMLIGRLGRQNAVNSMKNLARDAGHSKYWQALGWLGTVTLLLTLSFYSVVAGWSIAYLIKAWSGAFSGLDAQQINHIWMRFLSNPKQLLIWHTLFMIMTMSVVARGVQNGLEKASRIMMPALFATLIVLVGYSTSTDGFSEAASFLFSPDFHKITMSVVIAAMGHAFFTLAIGAGAMLIYGSYLNKEVHLGGTVLTIAGLDVLVAFLAGLAIFPIVFTYHLPAQEGPGLMFEILPIAFGKMGGGQFFGGLFFLLLMFAAWTSSISMAEPLVALLSERYMHNRAGASILVGVVVWLLGIASVLSFNTMSGIKLLGHWNFFGAITDLTTNILLPIGGFGFSIFAGWVMHKQITRRELALPNRNIFEFWLFLVRYIAPLGILVILVSSVF